MIDTAKFKTMLENSKQEITDWNKYSKSSTRPVSLDESIGRVSRIDAIQSQQMALAAERRRIQELQRIEAALKRIDSGDYGYCMVCEEEISEKGSSSIRRIPYALSHSFLTISHQNMHIDECTHLVVLVTLIQ